MFGNSTSTRNTIKAILDLAHTQMALVIASDSMGRNLKECITQNNSFEAVEHHTLHHILKPGAKYKHLGMKYHNLTLIDNTSSRHMILHRQSTRT